MLFAVILTLDTLEVLMALFASDFDLTILYRLKCLYRQNEQKRKGNLVSLAFCVLLKHLKHQFWKKKELVRRAKIKLTQITNALLCIFCQKLRRRWGLNFDILWMTLTTTTGTEQKMWWWSNFEQLIFFAFVAEIAKLKRNTVAENI